MKKCLLFLILLALSACSPPKREVINPKGRIVHTVILKLKNEVTDEQRTYIAEQLKSLSSIRETQHLFVGSYESTEDRRARTDYDFVLEMQFNNHDALKQYGMNEYHLNVRKNIKSYLAAPPIVYDYKIE